MKYWPIDKMNIYGILNSSAIVQLKWKNILHIDYYNLSNNYYDLGCFLAKTILEDSRNHEKTDMWFFVTIALFRQSIELILKSLICKLYSKNIRGNKEIISRAFVSYKHSLSDLFSIIIKNDPSLLFTEEEINWLKDYLESVDLDDNKSDIFRYPFNHKFYLKYDNSFISVSDTVRNLIVAYTLLDNCYSKKERSIVLPENYHYLVYANDGLSDCYMWDIYEGSFFRHITGYEETIKFILSNYDYKNNYICIFFLYRNLIELLLKYIYSLVCKINKKKIINCGHDIKEIIMKLKNIDISLANDNDFNIVCRELLKIHQLDKKGDVFRYPTDFSFNYRLDGRKFDLDNSFDCYKRIYSFLRCLSYKYEEEYDLYVEYNEQ